MSGAVSFLTLRHHFLRFCLIYACVSLAALLPATCARATDWHQINEALLPELDGKEWQTSPDLNQKNDQMAIAEFVPVGQTVNDWKEILTMQTMPGEQLHMTARQMADAFLARMKTHGATSRIIKESPDSILFEWRILAPAELAQYELDKIVAGKQAMHFLHYANKNPDPPQRALWLKNFESAHVLNVRDPSLKENSPP